MIPILELIVMILNLYWYVILVSAVISWLIAFNVINTRNQAVYMIRDFCWRLTEPVLRPIRSVIPPVNGIDLSPVILLFIIWLIEREIEVNAYALLR